MLLLFLFIPCVVCYQEEDEHGYTQSLSGEHFTAIKEGLDKLIKLGVQIKSITTHVGIKAFSGLWANHLLMWLFKDVPGTHSKNVFALTSCFGLKNLMTAIAGTKAVSERKNFAAFHRQQILVYP